jgi:Mce-associated membrane protein
LATESPVETESSEHAQAEAVEQGSEDIEPVGAKRRINWCRVLAYGVLPGLALLLAMAAGFLKWQDSLARGSETARIESVAAAKDSTIALLAYQPDTVEKTVAAAQDRVTAPFKDAYTELTHDVVIPGAKQKHVSVSVTVPAAASVSATPQHAVTLLFVNQSAVVGTDPPVNTISSIRVTLKKIGGRWLISGFDPV